MTASTRAVIPRIASVSWGRVSFMEENSGWRRCRRRPRRPHAAQPRALAPADAQGDPTPTTTPEATPGTNRDPNPDPKVGAWHSSQPLGGGTAGGSLAAECGFDQP